MECCLLSSWSTCKSPTIQNTVSFILSADRLRLDTFFEFMYQFNFFMSAKDFRRRLVLPASHPNSPHPALMTSIYLVASHFSARELSDWQPVLVRRTHQLICQSAALGDRPMDLCMAAVMFARFCFHTTRFDLGLCYASCEYGQSLLGKM